MILEDEYKDQLDKWIEGVLDDQHMQTYGFESIDLEEFLGIEIASTFEQVKMAFEAYREVVNAYASRATEFKASLHLSLEYSDSLQTHQFDELHTNKVVLRQPPEIYISKRSQDQNYFVIEQYRRAFTQDFFRLDPKMGKLYSYYQSQNTDDDLVTNVFTVEHYPVALLEDVNGITYIRNVLSAE